MSPLGCGSGPPPAAASARRAALTRVAQKCNKLHPLDAFDGTKKTCIKLLEQHNSRRRDAYAKRKTEGGQGAVRGRGGGRGGKRPKAGGEAILLAAEMLSGDAPAAEDGAEAGAEAGAAPAGMLSGWLQTHSANPAAPEAITELVASAQADPATMSALLTALSGAPQLAEPLP